MLRKGTNTSVPIKEYKELIQSTTNTWKNSVSKKRNAPEAQLHITCVDWFYHHYNYHSYLLAHHANESKVPIQYRVKLKKMGLRSGMPDLMLYEPHYSIDEIYCGLAIEFKAKKGRITPSQQEVMDRLSINGWLCHVVYSLDQFIEVVIFYLD